MKSKKVTQTASANPYHYKTKITSIIAHLFYMCEKISENKIFEYIIEPLLVGGLLLISGFWYWFTPLF